MHDLSSGITVPGDFANKSAAIPDILGQLGPGSADIVLLTKGGVEERAWEARAGQVPLDFYYGFPSLLKQGLDARMQSTSEAYPGVGGWAHRWAERIWARMTGISRRHHYLDFRAECWRNSRVVISLTDQFSFTLGTYFAGRHNRPFTIGVFHGFSDFRRHLTNAGCSIAPRYVRKALTGLDHVAFLGPADRDEAIRTHHLDPARTSQFWFGIDTDFWCVDEAFPAKPDQAFAVLAVGSDPNRDFDTLARAPLDCPVRIVTRLPVDVPSERTNVTVTRGNYADSPLSDRDLRELYRNASAVVVPIHDVFQPSGTSVSLQAMACGTPLVLTRTKGHWAPQLFVDGENCLFVPPGDSVAIADAVNQLRYDSVLRQKLSRNGRDTVFQHFDLRSMETSLQNLIAQAPAS